MGETSHLSLAGSWCLALLHTWSLSIAPVSWHTLYIAMSPGTEPCCRHSLYPVLASWLWAHFLLHLNRNLEEREVEAIQDTLLLRKAGLGSARTWPFQVAHRLAHTGQKQPVPDPGDPLGVFFRGRVIPICLPWCQGDLLTSLSQMRALPDALEMLEFTVRDPPMTVTKPCGIPGREIN